MLECSTFTERNRIMFQLNTYIEPDFTQKYLMEAPDCTLVKAPHAKAAPKGFHATSIYPEYFKINGLKAARRAPQFSKR